MLILEIKLIDSENGVIAEERGNAMLPMRWSAGLYVVGHGGLVLDGFNYSPNVSLLKPEESNGAEEKQKDLIE